VTKSVAIAVALLALAGCGGGGSPEQQPPPPGGSPQAGAPLPREAPRLADDLAATTKRLRAEIEEWTGRGNPARGGPPPAVAALARRQQRIYRLLEPRRRLGRRVLARLPRSVAGEARDTLAARRALRAIPASGPRPKIRLGPAEPAGRLRRHYARAQRRFGVRWNVLAAVNFVESAFGRLRNRSSAGARGPMQFIPATWRAYGLGGDVDEPRDAILGAANYLHANGAPARNRRALYAYNRSLHYVDAVMRFASRMRRDSRAFYAYYSWSPPRMN
jgi:soluble lytic murein transglycosylase-like protein